MKRRVTIAIILGLAAAAACGQTAMLTAPQAGVSWAQSTTQAITWTWKGAAQVKLVLVRQGGGKVGIIKSGLPLSAGTFGWKVGTLEDGTSVPAANDYLIRISTMDSKILNASPVFSIGGQAQPQPPDIMPITLIAIIPPQPKTATPIVFSLPGKNDVWIPLKTYALKWSWTYSPSANESNAWINNCPGFPVDAWIIPTAAPAQKIPLFKQFCCTQNCVNQCTVSGKYEGIVPNLAAGSYFVRVARSDQPGFFGDSPAFAVKSTLAADTAFLGPDPGQGQVDLALTDVFFDSEGKLLLKIKNLGDAFLDIYNNVCKGSYEISYSGNYSKPDIKAKGEFTFIVNAKANQEQSEVFLTWGGHNFSEAVMDEGNYIPLNTRPFWISVKIMPANDSNPTNNFINKSLCMIQGADIGTNGEIMFKFGPQDSLYINRETSNRIHQSRLKWLSDDTFEAELEVGLWNYGAAAKTFDCWLYVDRLPGQLLSTLSLQPGQKTAWKQLAKIKLPSRCGDHRIVFIADPKEHGNEPYHNSYMNNFIPVTLKILCDNTVTGSGW